jgi:hypothetical protein
LTGGGQVLLCQKVLVESLFVVEGRVGLELKFLLEIFWDDIVIPLGFALFGFGYRFIFTGRRIGLLLSDDGGLHHYEYIISYRHHTCD